MRQSDKKRVSSISNNILIMWLLELPEHSSVIYDSICSKNKEILIIK